MKDFVSYLVEANVGICFFLALYAGLLKKETDYTFNRAYLLLALLVALALPFFHFQLPPALQVDPAMATHWLPGTQIGLSDHKTVFQWDLSFWLASIYVSGAVVFALVFLIHFLIIAFTLYQSPRHRHGSVWVIESKSIRGVFSFFNFIVIGNCLPVTELEKRQIIRHEQVHVRQHHSFDILFINLLGILFWFNPFLRTYRKSLVQLHEFEADARSVEEHEVDAYCCLLAKAALESSGFRLANHFTNSLTLKRIEMMKTVKTKIAKWKIVTITGTALFFGCLITGNGLVLAQTDQKNNRPDEVFEQVDQLPTFGSEASYGQLYEIIAKTLRYPDEARKSKIEGKVLAEFVVEKDGSLSNVRALKGIGHGCDEEVVRVVKALPSNWKPGEKDGKIVRTKFVMPIVFKLSEPKKGD